MSLGVTRAPERVSRGGTSRVLPASVWIGVAGVCAAGMVLNPYKGQTPACPFHALTGLYCPFCGISRVAYSLMHGNVKAALAANPLIVVSLPVLFYMLVAWTSAAAGGSHLKQLPVTSKTPWIVFGVLMVYGVLRNLPGPVFRVLGP